MSPFVGYRLGDAGPHPNKAHAAWGRRAHRLEPDPATAPVVTWMFAQRLAGHSAARITRALNDAGVPCPSASDPVRNPHRTGAAWTLRTVAAILANPRYMGRQVWNRQPSGAVLVDPANPGLGHRQVQRWNLPEGWVCGRCGRRLESAWSHGRAAYRCRHGYSSATVPDPVRPKSTYLREDQVLPHLAALAILRVGSGTPDRARQVGITAPAQIADLIDQLRANGVVLTYDPQDKTLSADGRDRLSVTVGRKR